jgi:HlyD family secretion protein
MKTALIIVLIVILAGVAGAWRWRQSTSSKLSFSTAPITRGDVIVTIGASGTVEPDDVVDVGAQVAGLIKYFGKDKNGKTIDYGSIVEEGTILAQIDDSVYAADVSLAKAQLDQAKAGELSAAAGLQQMKAKAVQAEADWNGAQKLGPSEALARTSYDSYKANNEIAKANIALSEAAVVQAKAATVQAQATLEKAQRNLKFCTIMSPVEGVIIDRRVNIGQTVVASLNAPSLFLIARDLTKMQIWVAVNEADVGRIAAGTPVNFTCDAFPNKEFHGVVGKVRLNASMTQNVVMYTVEVDTDNSQNILLPYLTANVQFVVHQESGRLLVPNAAARWSPSSEAEVSPDARSSTQPGQEQGAGNNAPKPSKPDKEPNQRRGVVWLKDGEFVRPVEVTLGASDGANTVIAASNLSVGQEVVIGEAVQTAQSDTRNPFIPQIRGR